MQAHVISNQMTEAKRVCGLGCVEEASSQSQAHIETTW